MACCHGRRSPNRLQSLATFNYLAMGQNPVPPVNLPIFTKKEAPKWAANSPTNQNGTPKRSNDHHGHSPFRLPPVPPSLRPPVAYQQRRLLAANGRSQGLRRAPEAEPPPEQKVPDGTPCLQKGRDSGSGKPEKKYIDSTGGEAENPRIYFFNPGEAENPKTSSNGSEIVFRRVVLGFRSWSLGPQVFPGLQDPRVHGGVGEGLTGLEKVQAVLVDVGTGARILELLQFSGFRFQPLNHNKQTCLIRVLTTTMACTTI